MPLRLIALIWTTTLALFYLDLLGAYENARNELILLIFMIVNIGTLLLINYIRVPTFAPILTDNKSTLKFFRWSLGVSLIILPVNIYIYTGASISEFIYLLQNPAVAYTRMHFEIGAERTERIHFLLVKLAVSWLTVAMVPLAIILHRMGAISTPRFVLALSCSFILSVFRGTDKEIADIGIYILGGLFIPSAKFLNAKNQPSKVKKKSLLYWLFLAIFGIFFIYIFFFRKQERLANITNHCFYGTNVCTIVDQDRITPFEFLFSMIYRYFTHGYYGLSASFDAVQNICPMIGHSRTLEYFASIVGYTCSDTIMDQLPKLGWTDRGAWSTGFTQLANDFGHFGVLPAIIFFAVLLKIFYKTFIKSKCFISGILFMIHFYILAYMIGNLQLQQSGESYFGYLFLMLFLFIYQIMYKLRR